MLGAKQDNINYHFLSLSYDSNWYWSPIYWAIGKHFTIRPVISSEYKQGSQLGW